MNYADKNTLVLGMGKTGISMVKWLSRAGARVSVADTRTPPPNLELLNQMVPREAIFCGPFGAELLKGIDVIAISPGVAIAEPLVQAALQQGVPVIGDIELFAIALDQHAPPGTKILAITGSNGKTTVATMVGEMAKNSGWDVEVAGNIGSAVLDALMQRMDTEKWPHLWVLELSSFQLETTSSLQPDAATVLNLSEDHLDRYATIEEYAAAKARIFHGPHNSCVQVLNRDDARVYAMACGNRKQLTFGLSVPAFDDEFGVSPSGSDLWLTQGTTHLMKISELAVTGLHNAANALAALALCRAIDLPFASLLHALHSFRGLPHRMQKIAEFNGVTFYDDSKSTNVGSAAAALKSFRKNVILIAGGDGKGQDFSPLEQPICKHTRGIVLLGRDAGKIAQAIQSCNVPVHYVTTMDEAVRVSFLLAEQGDVVLLSPACASLDMFNDYVHRAEVFTAAVQGIAHKFVFTAQTCH
ncbi:UDP-N-acetylmuramoyl-L-alanine--D-glutamate ligase [Nitrosomonas sp. HPC101]|uniref:UDP-N-acetylmuramoyl-L-alanine--D-glutamate ligase n=1 Tax=Nitrosomonas sp. HPC101 TaxID=1658667 RepID=UPI00136F54EA|nr:UDP-N-acetylmuramoyl-L-alanine--D-glutamate ligase [Nitrosomonas sp. HPC101]MXS86392.1 UDP-N-acetylmuramoyl-L-alanine--D-glutamate ligase [Nitrosomonas sp. HPC101]